MSRAEWRVRDPSDYALDFDGTSDTYVSLNPDGDFYDPSGTENVTLAAAFVVDSTTRQDIVNIGTYEVLLMIDGDGNISAYLHNGTDAVQSDWGKASTGTAYVAVLRYDGSSLRIAVDSLSNEVSEPQTGTIRDRGSDAKISSSGNLPLDGRVSEVIWYSDDLTDSEVRELLAGNPPSRALENHYKLNDGSGTTATDSAGTSDGAITGASWVNPENNPLAIESGLIDGEITDAYNRFARNAKLELYDPDGSKIPSYPKFRQVEIEIKPPGGSFTREFGGFVAKSKTDDNRLILELLSHDLWLRRRNPFVNFSAASISSILQTLIETYTPLDWVAGNVTVVNDVSITDEWKGESLGTIIEDLATASAGEEFGANDAGEFFFRPRETSAASRNFTVGQYYNADFEEDASQEINRVVVYYTADSSVGVAHQDRESQKQLADDLGYSSPAVVEIQRDHPEIPNRDAAERKAESILDGGQTIRTGSLRTWRGYDLEPGEVTKVVVPDQGVDGEYRIAEITYSLRDNGTDLALAENSEGVTDVLVNLSGEVGRVDLKGADSGAVVDEVTPLEQAVEIKTELAVYTRSVPDTQFAFGAFHGGFGDPTSPNIDGGYLGDQRGDLTLFEEVEG